MGQWFKMGARWVCRDKREQTNMPRQKRAHARHASKGKVGVSRHRWAKRERGAWAYTARRGCVVMEWHNTPSGEHEQGVRVRNNTPYLGGVFAGVNADL